LGVRRERGKSAVGSGFLAGSAACRARLNAVLGVSVLASQLSTALQVQIIGGGTRRPGSARLPECRLEVARSGDANQLGLCPILLAFARGSRRARSRSSSVATPFA